MIAKLKASTQGGCLNYRIFSRVILVEFSWLLIVVKGIEKALTVAKEGYYYHTIVVLRARPSRLVANFFAIVVRDLLFFVRVHFF